MDKREHVLAIYELLANRDIGLAAATAGFYGIDDGRANEIVDGTGALVSAWKHRARKLGIAAGDIELIGIVFSALDDKRAPISGRFIGQRSAARKQHELKEESAQAVTRLERRKFGANVENP